MSAINAAIPLQGQQPQIAGPLDWQKQGLNVQQLINAVQLQKQQQASNALRQQQEQIDLEQSKQQQSDTQSFNKAFHDANGDWDKAISAAPGLGVSGQFLIKAQQARAEQIAKIATANKDLIANEQSKTDQVGKDAARLLGIDDPDERASTYAQIRNGHILAGSFKPGDLPEQVPDEDHLKSIVAHSKAAQDIYKAAADARDAAAKATIQEQEAKLTPQERANLKASGDLGIVEMKDWIAKNPGKGPSDYKAWAAKLVPQFNFNLTKDTGAGAPAADVAKKFGMTPEAFDQTAEKYFQTGTMPPIGRSGSGMALQRAIMNRAGELHTGQSLAAGSAAFAANKQSLGKLQTTFDNVNAFENTAGKNLDVFLDQAKKVTDSGLPVLNTPARYIAKKLGGTDQAAFETARTTALTEIAKVLSSAGAGSGVLSDSARHEVEGLISPDATLKQIIAASNILKTDMANRHDAYQKQIEDIKGRMGGQPQGGGGAQGGPSKFSINLPNGKTAYFPTQKALDDFKKEAGL